MPRQPHAILVASLLPALLAAGCATRDPMAALPPAERAALLAEPGGTSGRVSVAEMLSRARGAAATPAAPAPAPASPRAAEPLVLRFTPGAVQPDAAQRAAIEAFAGRATGGPRVLVVAHRAEAASSGDALLGQRRAVAVARLLEPRLPDVELRFEPGAAAGEIVLLPEGSLGR